MYREKIVRFEQDNEIVEEIKFLKDVPYRQLVEYGYVDLVSTQKEKVLAVRGFLGVSNLKNVSSLMEQLAFRKSGKASYSILSIACWVKMCEIETNKIEVIKLKKNLINICLRYEV